MIMFFIIELRMWLLFLTPGEFGVVYRAKVRQYKKEMAVKTLKGLVSCVLPGLSHLFLILYI